MNLDSENKAPPQKLKERLKEAATAAMLTAAEQVFAEQGLHAARMEDIATRAGVSVGTLYNHFKDRDALLASLVAARREELFSRVDEALATTERQPFADQLRALIIALAEHLELHKPFKTILLEAEHSRDARVFPVAVSGKRQGAMAELYARCEELVRRGIKAKVLRAEDPSFFATMLMGMLRGSMIRQLHYTDSSEARGRGGKPPPDLSSRAEAMVRFFLQGAES